MPVAILKASVCEQAVSNSAIVAALKAMSSTHLEPSVALLRAIGAAVSVVVSLVVSVSIAMVSSLTRPRERVRHLCWCSSRRGDLRGSSGGDFPGRFAGADLDKVVLARSEFVCQNRWCRLVDAGQVVAKVRARRGKLLTCYPTARSFNNRQVSAKSKCLTHGCAKRWKGGSRDCSEKRKLQMLKRGGKRQVRYVKGW
jgi:hypothetical protein